MVGIGKGEVDLLVLEMLVCEFAEIERCVGGPESREGIGGHEGWSIEMVFEKIILDYNEY